MFHFQIVTRSAIKKLGKTWRSISNHKSFENIALVFNVISSLIVMIVIIEKIKYMYCSMNPSGFIFIKYFGFGIDVFQVSNEEFLGS